MSSWGDSLRRTLLEYHGAPLNPRECVSCGKELITDEPNDYIEDYGLVCVDCVDYIREEVGLWD